MKQRCFVRLSHHWILHHGPTNLTCPESHFKVPSLHSNPASGTNTLADHFNRTTGLKTR